MILKRMIMWLYTKARIINEFNKLNKIVERNISDLSGRIIELDQNKIYLLKISENIRNEEIGLIDDLIKAASKRVKWTAPPLIIINKDIELLSEKQINNIIKYKKTSVNKT